MTQLYKPSQVATWLSVTTRTLERYCSQGLLECVRLPGGKRFTEEQVKDFLDRFNPKPTEQAN